MVTPIAESGRALRVVGRLMAALTDPVVLERVRTASTREGLIDALGAASDRVGESPLSSRDALALLGSSEVGLTTAEAEQRLRSCGPNRLERVARKALALRFLEQFASFFAVLLWVGGAFAFLAGMAELGWAIFAVIVINGLFSFVQEYRAERALEALEKLLPSEITVRRDGEEVRVPTIGLVPGDVVLVQEGDQVPADGQLLVAACLRVDQSLLTGESQPVFKLPAVADDRHHVPRRERGELCSQEPVSSPEAGGSSCPLPAWRPRWGASPTSPRRFERSRARSSGRWRG